MTTTANDLVEQWARSTDPGATPITAAEVLARLDAAAAPRSVYRQHRLLAAAAIVVVALALGGAALALRPDGSTKVTTVPTTVDSSTDDTSETDVPAPHRDLANLPIPDGMTPVGDHDGLLVGYVANDDIDLGSDTFPYLELAGRKTRLRGVPVVDDRNELVGYEVIQLGFVDLVEAEHPDALEKRLEEADAATEKYLETQPPPTIPGG